MFILHGRIKSFHSIDIDKRDISIFALLWNSTQIKNTIKSIHSLNLSYYKWGTIKTSKLLWHKQFVWCDERKEKNKNQREFLFQLILIPTVGSFCLCLYFWEEKKRVLCGDQIKSYATTSWMNEWMNVTCCIECGAKFNKKMTKKMTEKNSERIQLWPISYWWYSENARTHTQ